MEYLVTALICIPFLMALLLYVIKSDAVRAKFIYIFGVLVAGTAIATAVIWLVTTGGEVWSADLPGTEIWNKVILVGDFVLMGIVIWLSFKHHKGIISLLSIVQTILVAWTELAGPEVTEASHVRIDWFTFIMILIIGIIGVAIGVYAVGYMRGYHVHHKEYADRRRFFFAMIFLFYGAMFGLVFSASVIWMYFFWEITSVTSFLLIGYTKTKQAETNSFRALWMNLLGGCGIAVAIWYSTYYQGTVDLYAMVDLAVANQGAALIPIGMLAFAALTKSAQFPFSGWLLGAMVAPTPSSALLHSATMVKAGVYLLVRISMAMQGNYVGMMVCLVGGFTFLAASCLAISHSDGKKVLAYSTISNLGLIVACAGAGTKETIWAAVFLIMFHAVSKSMLFQCVGAIENTTGSRSIEDMQGLMQRFPKLGFILMVGIAGMFLAPFGMLISKWAALTAFVDNPNFIMTLFIAFGSATTMFYWTKWLTKILGQNEGRDEHDVTQRNEYVSMFFHAALVILLGVGFPLLSKYLIEPLLADMFGEATQVISSSNIIIMVVMIVAIFVVPALSYAFTNKKLRKQPILGYMSGINTGDNKHFYDSYGEPKELEARNWYMMDIFSDEKLFTPCVVISTICIVVFLCLIVGGAL